MLGLQAFLNNITSHRDVADRSVYLSHNDHWGAPIIKPVDFVERSMGIEFDYTYFPPS